MADTRRQQILDVIETQLKTIDTPIYETKLGDNVFIDRDKAPEDSECPCIIVDQEDEELVPIAFHAEMHALILTMTAHSITSSNIKDKMRADIIVAMNNSGDETWGALADDTRIFEGQEQEVKHEDRKIETVIIAFRIEYQTAINDPYNLPS